jgi:hypothetical protein
VTGTMDFHGDWNPWEFDDFPGTLGNNGLEWFNGFFIGF